MNINILETIYSMSSYNHTSNCLSRLLLCRMVTENLTLKQSKNLKKSDNKGFAIGKKQMHYWSLFFSGWGSGH